MVQERGPVLRPRFLRAPEKQHRIRLRIELGMVFYGMVGYGMVCCVKPQMNI